MKSLILKTVFFKLNLLWVIPVALTVVNTKSAAAQTVYPFDVFYDTTVTLTPTSNPSVSLANVSGINNNAPYGLTNFTSLNYSQTQFVNNIPVSISFNPDPAAFGLQGAVGTDKFFGSGQDQLFGISKATATFDYANNLLVGSGTETIIGGTGRFTGAIGILTFSESEPLNEDPNASLRGRAFLKGSFQIAQVPEPRTNLGLCGLAMMGVGFLRRFKHSS